MRIFHDWTARVSARRALGNAVRGRLVLTEVLKRSSEATVIAGRLDGRDVVLKRMLGAAGADRAGAQADELAVQHPRMADGPNRVPEPIIALPARGIVVMERAPGLRFDKAILARPEDRARLIRRAGAWLSAYTAERRAEDAFGGGFWIKVRRQAAAERPAGADRSRLEGLVTVMEAERARIGPRPITRARSHGDFSPVNLLVDGETLWGLDIHNNTWIALAKDLARFLVHLEITLPHPRPDRPPGVAEEDIEALLGAPGLIRRGEIETVLPFFAAVEVSGRLLTETACPDVIDRARRLADRMLG